MLINAKINLIKYTIYSAILLALSFITTRSPAEFGVIVLVFLAACANHWMLVYTVRKMSEAVVGPGQKSNLMVTGMILGKLILVVGALSFGVQIMGKRIIIPVLIYVLQIVVLYLSFEKNTSAELGDIDK